MFHWKKFKYRSQVYIMNVMSVSIICLLNITVIGMIWRLCGRSLIIIFSCRKWCFNYLFALNLFNSTNQTTKNQNKVDEDFYLNI